MRLKVLSISFMVFFSLFFSVNSCQSATVIEDIGDGAEEIWDELFPDGSDPDDPELQDLRVRKLSNDNKDHDGIVNLEWDKIRISGNDAKQYQIVILGVPVTDTELNSAFSTYNSYQVLSPFFYEPKEASSDIQKCQIDLLELIGPDREGVLRYSDSVREMCRDNNPQAMTFYFAVKGTATTNGYVQEDTDGYSQASYRPIIGEDGRLDETQGSDGWEPVPMYDYNVMVSSQFTNAVGVPVKLDIKPNKLKVIPLKKEYVDENNKDEIKFVLQDETEETSIEVQTDTGGTTVDLLRDGARNEDGDSIAKSTFEAIDVYVDGDGLLDLKWVKENETEIDEHYPLYQVQISKWPVFQYNAHRTSSSRNIQLLDTLFTEEEDANFIYGPELYVKKDDIVTYLDKQNSDMPDNDADAFLSHNLAIKEFENVSDYGNPVYYGGTDGGSGNMYSAIGLDNPDKNLYYIRIRAFGQEGEAEITEDEDGVGYENRVGPWSDVVAIRLKPRTLPAIEIPTSPEDIEEERVDKLFPESKVPLIWELRKPGETEVSKPSDSNNNYTYQIIASNENDLITGEDGSVNVSYEDLNEADKSNLAIQYVDKSSDDFGTGISSDPTYILELLNDEFSIRLRAIDTNSLDTAPGKWSDNISVDLTSANSNLGQIQIQDPLKSGYNATNLYVPVNWSFEGEGNPSGDGEVNDIYGVTDLSYDFYEIFMYEEGVNPLNTDNSLKFEDADKNGKNDYEELKEDADDSIHKVYSKYYTVKEYLGYGTEQNPYYTVNLAIQEYIDSGEVDAQDNSIYLPSYREEGTSISAGNYEFYVRAFTKDGLATKLTDAGVCNIDSDILVQFPDKPELLDLEDAQGGGVTLEVIEVLNKQALVPITWKKSSSTSVDSLLEDNEPVNECYELLTLRTDSLQAVLLPNGEVNVDSPIVHAVDFIDMTNTEIKDKIINQERPIYLKNLEVTFKKIDGVWIQKSVTVDAEKYYFFIRAWDKKENGVASEWSDAELVNIPSEINHGVTYIVHPNIIEDYEHEDKKLMPMNWAVLGEGNDGGDGAPEDKYGIKDLDYSYYQVFVYKNDVTPLDRNGDVLYADENADDKNDYEQAKTAGNPGGKAYSVYGVIVKDEAGVVNPDIGSGTVEDPYYWANLGIVEYLDVDEGEDTDARPVYRTEDIEAGTYKVYIRTFKADGLPCRMSNAGEYTVEEIASPVKPDLLDPKDAVAQGGEVTTEKIETWNKQGLVPITWEIDESVEDVVNYPIYELITTTTADLPLLGDTQEVDEDGTGFYAKDYIETSKLDLDERPVYYKNLYVTFEEIEDTGEYIQKTKESIDEATYYFFIRALDKQENAMAGEWSIVESAVIPESNSGEVVIKDPENGTTYTHEDEKLMPINWSVLGEGNPTGNGSAEDKYGIKDLDYSYYQIFVYKNDVTPVDGNGDVLYVDENADDKNDYEQAETAENSDGKAYSVYGVIVKDEAGVVNPDIGSGTTTDPYYWANLGIVEYLDVDEGEDTDARPVYRTENIEAGTYKVYIRTFKADGLPCRMSNAGEYTVEEIASPVKPDLLDPKDAVAQGGEVTTEKIETWNKQGLVPITWEIDESVEDVVNYPIYELITTTTADLPLLGDTQEVDEDGTGFYAKDYIETSKLDLDERPVYYKNLYVKFEIDEVTGEYIQKTEESIEAGEYYFFIRALDKQENAMAGEWSVVESAVIPASPNSGKVVLKDPVNGTAHNLDDEKLMPINWAVSEEGNYNGDGSAEDKYGIKDLDYSYYQVFVYKNDVTPVDENGDVLYADENADDKNDYEQAETAENSDGKAYSVYGVIVKDEAGVVNPDIGSGTTTDPYYWANLGIVEYLDVDEGEDTDARPVYRTENIEAGTYKVYIRTFKADGLPCRMSNAGEYTVEEIAMPVQPDLLDPEDAVEQGGEATAEKIEIWNKQGLVPITWKIDGEVANAVDYPIYELITTTAPTLPLLGDTQEVDEQGTGFYAKDYIERSNLYYPEPLYYKNLYVTFEIDEATGKYIQKTKESVDTGTYYFFIRALDKKENAMAGAWSLVESANIDQVVATQIIVKDPTAKQGIDNIVSVNWALIGEGNPLGNGPADDIYGLEDLSYNFYQIFIYKDVVDPLDGEGNLKYIDEDNNGVNDYEEVDYGIQGSTAKLYSIYGVTIDELKKGSGTEEDPYYKANLAVKEYLDVDESEEEEFRPIYSTENIEEGIYKFYIRTFRKDGLPGMFSLIPGEYELTDTIERPIQPELLDPASVDDQNGENEELTNDLLTVWRSKGLIPMTWTINGSTINVENYPVYELVTSKSSETVMNSSTQEIMPKDILVRDYITTSDINTDIRPFFLKNLHVIFVEDGEGNVVPEYRGDIVAGDYYFWIRAIKNGVPSDWSNMAQVNTGPLVSRTVPSLVLPVAVEIPFIEVDWTPVDKYTVYEMEVARDNEFTIGRLPVDFIDETIFWDNETDSKKNPLMIKNLSIIGYETLVENDEVIIDYSNPIYENNDEFGAQDGDYYFRIREVGITANSNPSQDISIPSDWSVVRVVNLTKQQVDAIYLESITPETDTNAIIGLGWEFTETQGQNDPTTDADYLAKYPVYEIQVAKTLNSFPENNTSARFVESGNLVDTNGFAASEFPYLCNLSDTEYPLYSIDTINTGNPVNIWENNNIYYFRVRAYTNKGYPSVYGEWSNTQSVVVNKKEMPPAPYISSNPIHSGYVLTNFNADKTYEIVFGDGPNPMGYDLNTITHYQIWESTVSQTDNYADVNMQFFEERSTGNGQTVLRKIDSAVEDWDINPPQYNTSYYYRARAWDKEPLYDSPDRVDDALCSEWSYELTAMVPDMSMFAVEEEKVEEPVSDVKTWRRNIW